MRLDSRIVFTKLASNKLVFTKLGVGPVLDPSALVFQWRTAVSVWSDGRYFRSSCGDLVGDLANGFGGPLNMKH